MEFLIWSILGIHLIINLIYLASLSIRLSGNEAIMVYDIFLSIIFPMSAIAWILAGIIYLINAIKSSLPKTKFARFMRKRLFLGGFTYDRL